MKVVSIGQADGGDCDRPLMDCGEGRFRYELACGHVLNRTDHQRWVNGELRQPKTIKCPQCEAGKGGE